MATFQLKYADNLVINAFKKIVKKNLKKIKNEAEFRTVMYNYMNIFIKKFRYVMEILEKDEELEIKMENPSISGLTPDLVIFREGTPIIFIELKYKRSDKNNKNRDNNLKLKTYHEYVKNWGRGYFIHVEDDDRRGNFYLKERHENDDWRNNFSRELIYVKSTKEIHFRHITSGTFNEEIFNLSKKK